MDANTRCKLLVVFVVLALSSCVRAADEEAIKLAVQRGVVYLRGIQGQDGSWTYQNHAMGATSIAGLALLECSVPKTDPAVQRALNFVRDAAAGVHSVAGADQTYDISLAILFLDRYGSKRDVSLIESLTVRLLGGQNAQGGWTYTCPTVKTEESVRLRESVLHTADQPRDASKRPGLEDLPKEIVTQLQQIDTVQPAGAVNGPGDNSNTQFATLGLWVGRRLGLPVEKALARLEARYRTSQNPDGGWGYSGMGMMSSKDTMTCAGLLGLAVAFGLAIEKEAHQKESGSKKPSKQPTDLTKDINVRAGLLLLGTVIGLPPQAPAALGFDGALNLKPEQRQGILNNAQLHPVNYYLMWSIERVAMAFDLQRIGNKDWYLWGSNLILHQQQPGGGWSGTYADGGIDTCFALLFLRRSNLAQDLTANLRGRVHDPGESHLRAKDLQGPRKIADTNTKPALDLGLKLPDAFGAPELDTTTPSGQLSQELVKATPQGRAVVLAKLRDSKGVVYTEALAAAIPHLNGPDKTKARDALATRLTRMSPATLRDKLKEDDIEIRRAAVLAAAMNEDKSFIPDILSLLKDPSPSVWRAVPAAMRLLGGKEITLALNATPAEREQARLQWEEWWRKNGMK